MCAKINFSFTSPAKFVADCVCKSCRTAHGASVVCWVGVYVNQFQLESGESFLNWYQSSNESERGFCLECGTRLFFRSENWPGEIHMSVACIHTPHDLKASGVGFKDEFPSWTAVALRDN